MNTKRVIVACLVVFVFIFGYEFVFHGIIMKDTYVRTANLWRPEAEMRSYMPWLLLGQFVLAVMFCVIYALGQTNRVGVAHGVGYGLLVGLLLSSPSLIMYAVQPLPLSLIGAWIVAGLIEMMIAGAILGAIYRPVAAVPTQPRQPVPL